MNHTCNQPHTTVTVYTTGPDCQQCRLTKKALDRAGISYIEVDLRHNDDARSHVTDELGYTQAPVVIVDQGGEQTHWSGFQPSQLTRLG